MRASRRATIGPRGRKLDHDRGAEVGEPIDDRGERDVGADREVVDEREGKHEVRAPALLEALALGPTPSHVRGGVDEILRERQDALGSLASELAVEAVNGHLVGVDGDRMPPPAAMRLKRPIAAEIPDEPRRLLADRRLDEAPLRAARPHRRSSSR